MGPLRRGGRVVECGGLENRFTGAPGDEGSNPSSSAIFGSDILPYPGPFLSVYAGAGVVANAIRSTEPLFCRSAAANTTLFRLVLRSLLLLTLTTSEFPQFSCL